MVHYRIVSAYHTFTQDFLFRFVKRIVSASAPLPLIPAPNNAFSSTVENVSGSGARRKSMRHTKRNQLCSVNVWLIVTNLQKEQRAGSPETWVSGCSFGHFWNSGQKSDPWPGPRNFPLPKSCKAPHKKPPGGQMAAGSLIPLSSPLPPAWRRTPPWPPPEPCGHAWWSGSFHRIW